MAIEHHFYNVGGRSKVFIIDGKFAVELSKPYYSQMVEVVPTSGIDDILWDSGTAISLDALQALKKTPETPVSPQMPIWACCPADSTAQARAAAVGMTAVPGIFYKGVGEDMAATGETLKVLPSAICKKHNAELEVGAMYNGRFTEDGAEVVGYFPVLDVARSSLAHDPKSDECTGLETEHFTSPLPWKEGPGLSAGGHILVRPDESGFLPGDSFLSLETPLWEERDDPSLMNQRKTIVDYKKNPSVIGSYHLLFRRRPNQASFVICLGMALKRDFETFYIHDDDKVVGTVEHVGSVEVGIEFIEPTSAETKFLEKHVPIG